MASGTTSPCPPWASSRCRLIHFQFSTPRSNGLYLQVFGKRYYESMPSMGLKSADAAYVLAFSVIMLNTDLHNDQVHTRCAMLQSQQPADQAQPP